MTGRFPFGRRCKHGFNEILQSGSRDGLGIELGLGWARELVKL